MDQSDADQLYIWVKQLSTEELRLLWRWIMLEWITRSRADFARPMEEWRNGRSSSSRSRTASTDKAP